MPTMMIFGCILERSQFSYRFEVSDLMYLPTSTNTGTSLGLIYG